MKQLNDLFLRDRFTFTKKSRQKLGLKQDDIFIVCMKYGGPESRRGILVENLRTKQKIEVPGDLAVTPERNNRKGKAITTVKEGIELLHLWETMEKIKKKKRDRKTKQRQMWRSRLSGILLAFVTMLVIYLTYLVVFKIIR